MILRKPNGAEIVLRGRAAAIIEWLANNQALLDTDHSGSLRANWGPGEAYQDGCTYDVQWHLGNPRKLAGERRRAG